MSHHGRFCWYDLMSTDPEGSRAFYAELLGWRTEAVADGPPGYEMIHAGLHAVGGIVPLDPAAGAPTHWVPSIAVDDAAAFCDAAAAAGAEIRVPPKDLGPGVFALVADPQGGLFSPWQPRGASRPEPPEGTPGVFCWHECLSTDAAGGAAFYGEVFGWDVEEMAMETGGMALRYHVFLQDGRHRSGIMDLPPEAVAQGARTHWLGYVCVDDVDAAAEKAASLGAAVLCPCTDIPDTGRFCVIQDPQGGMLSLFGFPSGTRKEIP